MSMISSTAYYHFHCSSEVHCAVWRCELTLRIKLPKICTYSVSRQIFGLQLEPARRCLRRVQFAYEWFGTVYGIPNNRKAYLYVLQGIRQSSKYEFVIG